MPEGSKAEWANLDIEALAKAALGPKGGPAGGGHLKSQRRFFDLEVESLVGHLRKAELAKYLEQNIEALQANQQITQVRFGIRFAWLDLAESILAFLGNLVKFSDLLVLLLRVQG